MSYATSDKRIAALKDERRRLISAKQDLERRVDELCAEVEAEKQRNAKLRELVSIMAERDVLLPCMTNCNPHDCRFYDSDICARIANLMHELGIEMPS